jgi:hypothetical protein
MKTLRRSTCNQETRPGEKVLKNRNWEIKNLPAHDKLGGDRKPKWQSGEKESL